jgi:eukaryotic-like serine/threonine-protein kinase
VIGTALLIGQTLGPYQILAKLGEGGMGEVYRARDTKLNRDVALKVLSAQFTEDAERVGRFRQEAIAASALNHPNILTIHEAGEAGGSQFIATEFIDGDTLRQILNRTGSLQPGEALAIGVQVASALTAAHEAGIVHRDIKPENVMVRRDRYIKVLDFGIAKLTQQQAGPIETTTLLTRTGVHTQAGVIVGTLAYMSPEQARGSAVDARSDIWSLGCLLYEMLAGRSPFAGATTTDVLVAILDREPAPLAEVVPRVPAELGWIIAKMLRKNPDERYRTSEEVLGDLRRLQQKLDLDSHQQRVRPRQTRATSRLVALAVGAALMAVVLASAWYWRHSSSRSPFEARSLAVLPLKSLDASEQYLGLGIADAVIRKTSQAGGLIVRPTSAVRRYVNEETDALTAAHQLGADVVLEGSVQRAGDRLRVSVNLLRAADGASIWADSFDMGMTGIFDIQDTVAQQVASHLRLKLDSAQQARLARRQTASPLAYEFYLKGLHSFDQRMTLSPAQISTTTDFFVKAIEADPGFALAHAHLAYAYATSAVFRQTEDTALPIKARTEIERAQALDPELPEIALARSQLLFSRYGGFQGAAAVRVLREAERLDPNVGNAELAYIYSHLGLADLAERAAQRALEIDPTSDFAKGQLLATYEFSAQYDRWLEAHQRLAPNDPIEPWFFLATGRMDEARRAIDQVTPGATFSQFFLLSHTALLAALKGDSQSAEAAIPSMLSRHAVKDPFYHHTVYMIACIYAASGKSAEAVRWLREAVATGFSPYPLFERVAFLDRIRKAPEFVPFMAELKATTEGYRREFESAR